MTSPTDLIALAVAILEHGADCSTPDRAAVTREAIEFVKTVPALQEENVILRQHLREIHALGGEHKHETPEFPDPHLDRMAACCIDGISELLGERKQATELLEATEVCKNRDDDLPVLVSALTARLQAADELIVALEEEHRAGMALSADTSDENLVRLHSAADALKAARAAWEATKP